MTSRFLPTRRLAVQLSLPIVTLALAFLVVATFYWSRAFERQYVGALTERLEGEVRLVAEALPWGLSGKAFDRVCRTRARALGARVTVIDREGAVLGESSGPSSSMENHGNRPEIVETRARGIGRAVRFSHTLGKTMLYVAVLDVSGREERFVRMAVPLGALVEQERAARQVLAYGFLAALVVGGGIAWLIARRILARVRRIEAYSRRIASGGAPVEVAPDLGGEGDELDSVERNLAEVAEELRDQLARTEDQRAKLEVVLRSMADGVVVLDVDGRIQLCNESARELLGIPSTSEPTAARLTFLCRNPDLDALIEEVLRVGASGVQRELVLTGREEPHIVHVSGAPLPEKKGPHGAILVFHDVTRVRQLEMVRADFVANVSHELRTPLTAIRGYAETLLHGAIDDRERAVHFLQVIDRHSRRLARLIDDLLSLSDLELGRIELHRHAIAVQSLVDGVLEMLEQQASSRSIRLVAEVPESVPRLFADRDRIEEVLINLVDNAIKYSTADTTVTVRARAVGGREVDIAVIDEGIGIPEQEIPRLTERFYRVDKARSRELGGTGLGLAIVKHIVQAHDGQLRIESRVNEGTTVTVRMAALREGPNA